MKKIFFIGIFLVLLLFFGKANASTCPFTKELSKGVTHQEIAELQRFLSNDSSIYPEKIVSGYYGALTVNAVKRFQEKAGLLESGNVDIATINALCMIFEQFVSQTGGYDEPAKVTAGKTVTPSATKTVMPVLNNFSSGYSCPFDKEFGLGDKSNAVSELQKFLSADSTIYPEKMVTGYYGNLTVNAVKRFQGKAGLLQSGKVDIATATVLCQMYISYRSSEPAKTDVSFAPTDCVVKTINLGPGYFESANNEVAGLQKYLNQKGFYPENIVSGFYGNLTATAVKRFQSNYGLSPSGIIDRETMSIICGGTVADSSGKLYSDLAISNIESDPAQIDVNVPVKITVGHKNIGDVASGNHRVSLLVNEKEVAFASVSGLKVGQETNSINHTWVCSEKGIYIFKIFVDSQNENIEKNKYNNVIVFPVNCGGVTQDLKYACNQDTKSCAISPIGTMTLKECNEICGKDEGLFPDLVPASLTPVKTKINEEVNLSIAVKNIGKSRAGASSYEIEFKFQGSSEKIEGVLGPLDSGQEQKIEGSFTCENPGIYRITASLDTKNEVKESNENNNKKEFVMECADKDGKVPPDPTGDEKDDKKDDKKSDEKPDLTTWFTPFKKDNVITSLEEGKNVVYAYVKNKSSVTVKTPFKMSFVWENCTKNESVGVLDFKDGIGANQEGVVVDKEKGWELPACDYKDPWKITAFIDSESKVSELDENNNKAVITCGVLNCSSGGSRGRDGGGGDDGGGGEDGGVPGGGCGSGGCSAKFDIGLYFAEKEKHGVPINKALTKESSYNIIVKNNSSLNYEKKFIVEVKKLECNNKETKLGEIEMTKVEGKTGGNVLYVLELKTEGKEAVYSCDPKNPWVLVAEAKIEDANKDNNKAILSCGDLKNCSGQPTGCDDQVCFVCVPSELLTQPNYCKEVEKGSIPYNEAKERHKTKALCDAKCSSPINVALGSNCHIVDGKGQCLVKVGGVKSYPTDTDCLKECGLIALQGTYRYKCVSGKCVATGETGIGTYATESICKNSCFSFFPSPSSPPVVASRYKCVSGKCVVTTETGTGTYATESICKNNCYTYALPTPSTPISPPVTVNKRYKCTNSKCVVTTETGTNTYSTEDACKKVCGYSFTNPAPPSFWEVFGSGW